MFFGYYTIAIILGIMAASGDNPLVSVLQLVGAFILIGSGMREEGRRK